MRMREILDGIVSGIGRVEDLQIIKEVAELMRKTALCALGRTAINPVLSTLYYYSDEYPAACRGVRCLTFRSKDLYRNKPLTFGHGLLIQARL